MDLKSCHPTAGAANVYFFESFFASFFYFPFAAFSAFTGSGIWHKPAAAVAAAASHPTRETI